MGTNGAPEETRSGMFIVDWRKEKPLLRKTNGRPKEDKEDKEDKDDQG